MSSCYASILAKVTRTPFRVDYLSSDGGDSMKLFENVKVCNRRIRNKNATVLPSESGAISSPAFRGILNHVSQYPLVKSENEVPSFIVKNQVWTILSKAAAEVRRIVHNDMVAALLVLMPDSGIKLVVKGWPASRASCSMRQIQAEIKTAKTLETQSNLVSTVLVAHPDEEGNWCMVTPFAGACVRHIVDHPDWGSKHGFIEREQIARRAAVHDMLALWRMHDRGLIYRDGKVDNMTFDAASGLFVKIDNGGVMRIFPYDYHPVCTPGYIPPEMRQRDAAGQYSMFWDPNKRSRATSKALDIWLSSYQVLDMVVGLGELHFSNYNFQSIEDTERHLDDMNAADFNKIIAHVPSRKARDYLRKTLHPDPNKRLTAAQALRHPWLKKLIPQALKYVADAAPGHAASAVAILDLFKDLQLLPGSFVAEVTPEDQQLAAEVKVAPRSVNTSSRGFDAGSSRDSCSCDGSGRSSCVSFDNEGKSKCDDSSSTPDYMPATPPLRRSSCAPAGSSPRTHSISEGVGSPSRLRSTSTDCAMDTADSHWQSVAHSSRLVYDQQPAPDGSLYSVTAVSSTAVDMAAAVANLELKHDREPVAHSSESPKMAKKPAAVPLTAGSEVNILIHMPVDDKQSVSGRLLHHGKSFLRKLCRIGPSKHRTAASALAPTPALRPVAANECSVAVPGCCGMMFGGFRVNKQAQR